MENQKKADYIALATEEFRRVVVSIDGCPDVLFLPRPTNEAEREGLRLFVAELDASGINVAVQLCDD
ncbi:hypothetical protein [Siccirubricoccus phaeus]|uniref:hypothetical protein n=1 Tax=Siccirubricoccus phaeus TaxID=2595053 RepID=UPI0011F3B49E|nr:hypothetical protein [Siccirubricoccus phaeus]